MYVGGGEYFSFITKKISQLQRVITKQLQYKCCG